MKIKLIKIKCNLKLSQEHLISPAQVSSNVNSLIRKWAALKEPLIENQGTGMFFEGKEERFCDT